MQLSQTSNVNFKGIEFTVPRAPRGTVREALDAFRENDSLIQYLEDELGADVFTKVTADGKLEMQLGAKFHKSYWEEPEEIKRTLKIVPIVDSKGKPIKATINPTDKKQNWMRKIDNFVDKCNQFGLRPKELLFNKGWFFLHRLDSTSHVWDLE